MYFEALTTDQERNVVDNQTFIFKKIAMIHIAKPRENGHNRGIFTKIRHIY